LRGWYLSCASLAGETALGHEFQSNRHCRTGGSGAARRRAGTNAGRRNVRSAQFVGRRIVSCGSQSRSKSRDGGPAGNVHALSVGNEAFLFVLAAGCADTFAAELSIDSANLPVGGARRRRCAFVFTRNDLAPAGLPASIADRRRAFDAFRSIRLSAVAKEQLCFLSVFELAGRFVRASTSKGDLIMHLKSVILGSAAVLAMSTIAALAQPATNSPPATSPAPSAATQTPAADQGTATQPAGTDAGGMTTGAKTTRHHHMHHVVHHRMHQAMHHAAKASSAEESSEEATTAQLNQQQAANPGSMPSGGMGGSNMNSGPSGAPAETPTGNSNPSTPGSDNGTQPPKNSDVPDNSSKDTTGNPH
jgi:hypothetical protein